MLQVLRVFFSWVVLIFATTTFHSSKVFSGKWFPWFGLCFKGRSGLRFGVVEICGLDCSSLRFKFTFVDITPIGLIGKDFLRLLAMTSLVL